jgi:hypothetical protein
MAIARIEREWASSGKGCLGKAADEEPVFVLRGQDELSEDLVREWAARAGMRLGPQHRKVQEALYLADLMAKWSPKKFPD